MRKVNLIALALMAVCFLAIPRALGQGGSAEQQIAALSDQLIQAQLKGHTSYLKDYADDALIVHSDGKLYTKAEEIASLKAGSLKYDSIDVRDRKIHVYGDTAVVNFLISFKGTVGGKPYSGDLRRTQVWVKQKGTWKTVAYQVTRIPASK